MHSYYRAACGLLLALTSMSVRATAQVPITAPGAPSAEALATLVMQTFSSGTPEAFAAYIKSETAKWAKVIKAAGIKAN